MLISNVEKIVTLVVFCMFNTSGKLSLKKSNFGAKGWNNVQIFIARAEFSFSCVDSMESRSRSRDSLYFNV